MSQVEDFLRLQSYRFADNYDVYVDYGKGEPIKMNNNEETFLDVEKFLGQLKTQPKISTHSIPSIDSHRSIKSNDDSLVSRPVTAKPKPCIRIREYNPKNQRVHLKLAVNGVSKSMKEHIPMANLDLQEGDFGDDAGLFVENRDFYLGGLADGVGGNHLLGVNSGVFSRTLLSTCRQIFLENRFHPKQLAKSLLLAMQHVQTKQIRGSSTLCLFTLDKYENILTLLNIGDSGLIVYRDGKIYHRSTCTMDSDDSAPQQLFVIDNFSNLPVPLNEKEIINSSSIDQVKIEKNDLIILASDGLWDVLKGEELHQIIERNQNQNLQNLADDLLQHAIDGYAVNSRDDILIMVFYVCDS